MNHIKGVAIITITILYAALILYPHHYSAYTPVSAVIGGAIFVILGAYSMLLEKSVKFKDFKIIYLIIAIFFIISHILIIIGFSKHGFVPGVDITLSWVYKMLGIAGIYISIPIIYPASYFMIAGTRRILGKEYIYIWATIIFFWFFSNLRLLMNYVLK